MPLWFASLCGRCEIAELLLAHGADVNAIVYASGDPLGNAIDEPMQTLLLRHGARITVEGIEDIEQVKAILEGRLAAQSLNVREPTPTELAEQMLWASVGSRPDIVRLCLPHMTRPANDAWWNYVLIHTALPESLKLLLEHGIDPDVVGDGGFTALHHLGSAYIRDEHRLELATILLDAGASLTKRDPLLKSTALGWACRWGRQELVKRYLQREADPREPDAEPWATPLAWAAKGGHQDIVGLLSLHGTITGPT
jgi:ankyrin repeat protein